MWRQSGKNRESWGGDALAQSSTQAWDQEGTELTISVFLGIYRKPFLLAQPGPLVKSREKVTLQCVSQIRFETFILVLHRDGVAQELLSLTGDPQDENSQANFSIDPVTATHAGTYRCYGSLSDSPYEWSAPSDPLDLVVTGKSVLTLPTTSPSTKLMVQDWSPRDYKGEDSGVFWETDSLDENFTN